MARKHTEDEVLKALRYKKDVRVESRYVYVLRNKVETKDGSIVINPNKIFDIGNRTWGKIDFLCNHCGYTLLHTDKFKGYGK
jgi:hypothetical protein